jgi:hypothetical protein
MFHVLVMDLNSFSLSIAMMIATINLLPYTMRKGKDKTQRRRRSQMDAERDN